MTSLKKRVVVGILGFALALSLVACNSDDPSITTPPGSDTTEPVGS